MASGLHHNPYFGSLQRRLNYTPNIVEVETHPYYGLPDVILLQNYGVLPGLVTEDLEMRQRMETEYRKSLLEHEMKKRFNSLLNIREEKLYEDLSRNNLNELNVNQWASNSYDFDRNRHKSVSSMKPTPYYPNLDANFMEMQNRVDSISKPSMYLDEKDEYDKQTENFFGKKPNFAQECPNFSARPDQYYSRLIAESKNSDLSEISEQFSDNFKDDSTTSTSFSMSNELGVANNVDDHSGIHSGEAWVNFNV